MSWLICVPSAIYRAIIRRCDVVDEAIVQAEVEWQSVPEEKAAYFGLLKHLFAVLDHEVANSRQFGEFVSLDAPVEADAQDVAEAMVEEEVFEFYQPDDTLRLADIIADSQHPDAATIAEQEELVDRSSEFAFAFDLLKDMPRLWRRIFLLLRVDGLDASSVSEILLIPSQEDTVQRWLMQAEAFIAAHLEEAGVSKDGNDWLQGVDWSALSVTRSAAASLWSRRRTMKNDLHLVCPHCQSINRVPTAKLSEHPNCGRCQQPLFTGEPIELTTATFSRHVERSDLPLLVDFWAPWCGPCKMMAPQFQQAARQLEPRVRLAKVNTEAEPPWPPSSVFAAFQP